MNLTPLLQKKLAIARTALEEAGFSLALLTDDMRPMWVKWEVLGWHALDVVLVDGVPNGLLYACADETVSVWTRDMRPMQVVIAAALAAGYDHAAIKRYAEGEV